MIYDVTLPIAPGMAVWPGDPDVACEALAFGRVRVSRWTLGSHTGTHVDAPVHFSAGPQTVDELDPAVLLGPCRVLDCGEAPVITTAVLSAHDFAGIERLLLRTRNSRHWQEHPRAFDDAFGGWMPARRGCSLRPACGCLASTASRWKRPAAKGCTTSCCARGSSSSRV